MKKTLAQAINDNVSYLSEDSVYWVETADGTQFNRTEQNAGTWYNDEKPSEVLKTAELAERMAKEELNGDYFC